VDRLQQGGCQVRTPTAPYDKQPEHKIGVLSSFE
jgi:hypothetical protein